MLVSLNRGTPMFRVQGLIDLKMRRAIINYACLALLFCSAVVLWSLNRLHRVGALGLGFRAGV